MVNQAKIKFFFICTALVLGAACGSASRKSAKAFKAHLVKNQFAEAEKVIRSGKFYPEDRNSLLRLMEMGTVKHLQEEYYQSLKYFDKAAELARKLFTKSISKKAATFITNDSSDNFYGEKYEVSFIRFYQAINHYKISELGKYESYMPPLWPIPAKEEKKKSDSKDVAVIAKPIPERVLTEQERRSHLLSSRAVLLDWDSLLDNYQKSILGKDHYKDDMTAKVLGAWIHRSLRIRADKTIAKGLYKEGEKLLFRNYNTYPTFNLLSDKFRSDFDKLPKLGAVKVKKDYIKATGFGEELASLLKEQRDTMYSRKKAANTMILLTEGLISSKEAKKISFPIGFNTLPYIGGGANKKDFVTFVRKVLAISSGANPSISFEIPVVKSSAIHQHLKVIIKKEDGTIVTTEEVPIISPLSDISEEALASKITAIKSRLGARLVTKHLAALAAAYVSYRTTVKKSGEAFGILIATGAYALANKGIQESEKADLRQWSSLPNNIRAAHLRLGPGNYKVYLEAKTVAPVENKSQRYLGDISVPNSGFTLFKKRIL